MKKTILIATMNNSKNNYGAVFQSYALSATVQKLGYEAFFLTIKNRTSLCSNNPKFSIRVKKKIMKILSLSTKREREVRAEKFEMFKSRTQKRVWYDTFEEMLAQPPVADVYLSGSDQVWNAKNLYPEFFFPFVHPDDLVISYAASMGSKEIPQQNYERFAKYISRYDAISVREDTMIDPISKFTDKEIHQHVDPVFLVDQKDWIGLEQKYEKLKYQKYIFSYFISWDRQNNEEIMKLKKELGLPLVAIRLGGVAREFEDQTIMDASPEEFLYLLHHAEMVLATSFHGVALSIIYNKPFIAVPGNINPQRIESLLRHYNLESHYTLDMKQENAIVNYDPVNKQIKKDREISVDYLSNSIENIK